MTMTGMGNVLYRNYASLNSRYTPKTIGEFAANLEKNDNGKRGSTSEVSKMRRALKCGGENYTANTPASVLDSMKTYSESIRQQRNTKENTSLAKMKLKYSFKKISSKIISSKTSTAAREVVASAKREIQKLKAARRTGKYDEEELEAALDHAKAMERIARKKARHLEEEEMAKRNSSDEAVKDAPAGTECADRKEDPTEKEIKELRDELGEIEEKSENEEYIESGEVTNEMISTICDGMEEMLDAIEELNDLMDELASNPVNMSPEDIDALAVKHRNKEMKEITKADADYLKALFEHYEKIKADGGLSLYGGGTAAPAGDVAAPVSISPAIDVAL